MMKKIISLLILSALISCSTSTIMVDIQRPADISVPQTVQDIIIANRSIAGKGNQVGNVIEGIFSGEGIGADKKGSEYCMKGLTNMLQNSNRYNLKNAGEIILNGTGTSTFPNLLEWSDVESICSSYGADALIVLSTFDSDSRIFEGKSVVNMIS